MTLLVMPLLILHTGGYDCSFSFDMGTYRIIRYLLDEFACDMKLTYFFDWLLHVVQAFVLHKFGYSYPFAIQGMGIL